jgi:hypothetical protein
MNILPTTTTLVLLIQKTKRPRQSVTNNIDQKCTVCTKESSMTTFFSSRSSPMCHQCTSFCQICHCGDGGKCCQNHASVTWPVSDDIAMSDAEDEDTDENINSNTVYIICSTCINDPPCTRTKGCRCTVAEGTKSCFIHKNITDISITMNEYGACNLCLSDRRKKNQQQTINTKNERRKRLQFLNLPVDKCNKSVLPSPSDIELQQVWVELKTYLSLLLTHMNGPVPVEFFKQDIHGRNFFYSKIAVAFGLNGNHYGFEGIVLAKKMVMWFTKGEQFVAGVVLRSLPDGMC